MTVQTDETTEGLHWVALGREIQRRRKQLDLDQEDLAARTGLAINSLSRVENGGATRVDTLLKIADALEWYDDVPILILRTGMGADEATSRLRAIAAAGGRRGSFGRPSTDEQARTEESLPPRFVPKRLDEHTAIAIPTGQKMFNHGRVLLDIVVDDDEGWLEESDMETIANIFIEAGQAMAKQFAARRKEEAAVREEIMNMPLAWLAANQVKREEG